MCEGRKALGVRGPTIGERRKCLRCAPSFHQLTGEDKGVLMITWEVSLGVDSDTEHLANVNTN